MVTKSRITEFKRIAVTEKVYLRLLKLKDRLGGKNTMSSTLEWLLNVRGDK